MNSKEIINHIEANIRFNSEKIKERTDAVIAVIPTVLKLNNDKREFAKEIFSPENEYEKKMYLEMCEDIINNIIIDYSSCINLVYGEVDAYIKKHVLVIEKEANETFKEFRKKFKKVSKTGEIYIMVEYLKKEQGIEFDDDEEQIIEVVNDQIRMIRNEVVHEGLNLNNRKYAEDILYSENITIELSGVQEIYQNNKNNYWAFMKTFLKIVDNKFKLCNFN
jgi:hypothetical protein